MRYFAKVFIFVILNIFLFALPSHAEKVTFVKEYTYQASELDSKASCRTISLEMVKRLLLEELGTYLISETEVKDFKLTKEQVKTYSAGIVGAEIMEDKWDGKTYWLKAKVSADPKEVQKSLKKIIDDKYQAKQLEETRKKAEELTKEVERLNKELAKAEGKQPSKKMQQEYKTAIQGLTAVEWFEKGVEAFKAERWATALESFNKLIELKPDYYAQAYALRGLVYGKLGDHQRAIKDYTTAINLKSDLVEAYDLRGNAYFLLGNDQEAIKDFTNTIELKPDYAEAYFGRGVVYGVLGNHQQAIKDLNKAIELKPDYAEAYSGRGANYYMLGNYQQAIKDLNQGIELTPDSFAYFFRGSAHKMLGNYQQAIKDYNKAIELKPDYAAAYNERGRAYSNLNNYQQAIKDYNKAIELKPDYAEAYFGRSAVYFKLGNIHQSIKDLQMAARLGYKPAQDFLRQEGISW